MQRGWAGVEGVQGWHACQPSQLRPAVPSLRAGCRAVQVRPAAGGLVCGPGCSGARGLHHPGTRCVWGGVCAAACPVPAWDIQHAVTAAPTRLQRGHLPRCLALLGSHAIAWLLPAAIPRSTPRRGPSGRDGRRGAAAAAAAVPGLQPAAPGADGGAGGADLPHLRCGAGRILRQGVWCCLFEGGAARCVVLCVRGGGGSQQLQRCMHHFTRCRSLLRADPGGGGGEQHAGAAASAVHPLTRCCLLLLAACRLRGSAPRWPRRTRRSRRCPSWTGSGTTWSSARGPWRWVWGGAAWQPMAGAAEVCADWTGGSGGKDKPAPWGLWFLGGRASW
jgi:hypothetical protein